MTKYKGLSNENETTMKTYGVTCTSIYNGYIEVQAKSAEEAVEIAQERMKEVEWKFGEQTADYAEEIK